MTVRLIPVALSRVACVQRVVAAEYGVDLSVMDSPRRTRGDVGLSRHVAMYLSRRLTDRSLPDIGRRFGGLHHTSVMHAIERVRTMVAADPAFAARVAGIAGAVGAALGTAETTP